MDKSSRVYIAGHKGMVGSAIYRLLEKQGYKNLLGASRQELDLTNQNAVASFFSINRPDYVFIAAAKVGGIKANMSLPAEFLYENLMIQNNLINQSHIHKVKKVCFLGSNCVYPRDAQQPLKEEYLLTGPFEPTNEGYAIAKLAGLRLVQYYHQEYGLKGVNPMPCNLYGPNDDFDPSSSHVLSATVKRFVDAVDENLPEVVMWGTGKATREFLHTDDLARAVLLLMETYDSSEIINVGSGTEVSIKSLATLVAKEAGYKGSIVWDTSKPDGMPRKFLDVSKLTALGFKQKITLEQGVKQHIQYYRTRKPAS